MAIFCLLGSVVNVCVNRTFGDKFVGPNYGMIFSSQVMSGCA